MNCDAQMHDGSGRPDVYVCPTVTPCGMQIGGLMTVLYDDTNSGRIPLVRRLHLMGRLVWRQRARCVVAYFPRSFLPLSRRC